MLTIEQIKHVCEYEKEDWQRKVNQGVLKEDRVQQLMALGGMEAVDKFLRALMIEEERQNSRLAANARPPRARPIYIPEHIRPRGRKGE